MRAIGRIFMVIIGFMAAVIAAALFLLVARVGLAPVGLVPAGSGQQMVHWVEIAVAGGFTAAMLGAAAFLPAVAAILVSEIASIRSVVFHGGIGGLLGLAAAFGFGVFQDGADGGRTTALVASGFVGGLVYWLLAGRHAGLADRMPPRDTFGAADKG